MTKHMSYSLKAAIVLLLLGCAYVGYTRFFGPGSPEVKTIPSGAATSTPASSVKATAGTQKPAVPPPVTAAAAPSAASYSSSNNLLALLNGLQSDPSKNREFLLAKAKASEECYAFSRKPNYAYDAAQSMKAAGKISPQLLDQLAKVMTERCSDLASSGSISLKDAKSLYAEAAADGSAEAKAHELGLSLIHGQSSESVDSLRSKSIDIINSGDPAAIFQLGNYFGTNSQFTGDVFGNEKASAAWELAACDMGFDCSANSSLLAQACLFGIGYCESGDLRYNMQQAQFSPADFDEVLALEAKIYAQIKNGNAAALFNQ